MSSNVSRKRDSFTARDPLGRSASDDPWRDFRDIEVLDFPLAFAFRHSLGKTSRFFLELENRRLMGTKCPHCGTVWMPPRPLCPEDRSIAEWVELTGRGTLEVAAPAAYRLGENAGEDQLVLGYVALEGASTLLFQRIRNFGDPARLVPGLALKAVWADQPVDHPMELFWFEPET